MRYDNIGLPEAKGKKVKFSRKLFSVALAALAGAWRWLVGGLNCFKAAENGSERAKKTKGQILSNHLYPANRHTYLQVDLKENLGLSPEQIQTLLKSL